MLTVASLPFTVKDGARPESRIKEKSRAQKHKTRLGGGSMSGRRRE
jgi:hypothetical protein